MSSAPLPLPTAALRLASAADATSVSSFDLLWTMTGDDGLYGDVATLEIRMADAIERRRSHLAFPRRLAFAIGVLRRMPDGLFDRFASRLTARLRSRGQLGGDE